MSTCNRMDLESLRSWLAMPKNFLGTGRDGLAHSPLRSDTMVSHFWTRQTFMGLTLARDIMLGKVNFVTVYSS
jgi:nitric oxide reductase activation protein